MRRWLLVALCVSLAIFVTVSPQQHQIASRGELQRHSHFVRHLNTFLDVAAIYIHKVSDALSCALKCLENARCISYNLAIFPDADDKYDCQLLATDKFNSSNKLMPSKNFSHYTIETPCEASPCQNGGTCRPVYEKGEYKCECAAGFAGTHCGSKVNYKAWKSCKEAYDAGHREDKVYTLSLDSGNHQVYCHMSEIVGCGSGGFTLVIKIDGAKNTFLYDSDRWTNKEAYNVGAGVSGFDEQETKLSTYWESSFNKVCLGMKVGVDLRFISIDQEAPSLYSLIADGQYRATSIGRGTWKSLISGSSLQRNCNKGGFNVIGASGHSKVKIGILSNNEDDCNANDSRIGFGAGGYPDETNSCGNAAIHGSDNGDKFIKAHGFILVQ